MVVHVIKLDEFRYQIPRTGAMRVPGIIYATARTIDQVVTEKAAEQVANVATLPGIQTAALAMPDVHWGYGFPIGGVAAFRVSDGVVSPGGIGYDINCGVRMLRTTLQRTDLEENAGGLLDALFRQVPSGVGSTGRLHLSDQEVRQVLKKGARWAVAKGYGSAEDLERTESGGCMEEADPAAVSDRAVKRGREQLGTLGAGNHFLEIQYVERIEDAAAAASFGLCADQVVVLIHTGSRGLGYQVCDDAVRTLGSATAKYDISIPDRQLVCAPVDSPEGRVYIAAMAAAANYAWANRQIITHWVRQTLTVLLGRGPAALGLEVVYDVAHNIGKYETYDGVRYFIHRKGATRAFGPGSAELPTCYRSVGQPVLVPGSMGTASWVLAGTAESARATWGSACHGAGRVSSRSEMLRAVRGQQLASELRSHGIEVRAESWKTLAEEAPQAYKNVDEVVEICHQTGIARKVARLKPLAVMKG